MNKKKLIKEIENELNETRQACYNLVDCFIEGHREITDVLHYLNVNRNIIMALDDLLEKAKD